MPPLAYRDDSSDDSSDDASSAGSTGTDGSDDDPSAGSPDTDGIPPAAGHDSLPLEALKAALADAESLPRREHEGENAVEVRIGSRLFLAVEEREGRLSTSVTEHAFTARGSSGINKNWILLDNQSTVDLISNPDLLEPGSIHETDGPALRVHSTGGISVTRMVGLLKGYGWVWFYRAGCANILSKHRVRKRYKVTCDDATSVYTVHAPHGPMRFVPSDRGLHYYDARLEDERHEAHAQAVAAAAPGAGGEPAGTDSAAVPTIAGNARRLKATADDIRRAERARSVEAVLGFPSLRDLKSMVRTQ